MQLKTREDMAEGIALEEITVCKTGGYEALCRPVNEGGIAA